MIFPIGDDNIEGGHKPFVSYSLIVINVVVYLIEIQLGESFVNKYAVTPVDVVQGDGLYTLLTSIFLHGDLMHLLGNMLFLWIFADNIEAIIGNFNFLMFYLIGGLMASGAHILTDAHSIIPTLGASGAISAVMGAYMIMFPKSRVKMIFILFFKKFHIPAFLFLIIWFVQQLYSGIGTWSNSSTGGVAWWAHIGGFVFGVIVGYFLKARCGHLYDYATPKA